MREPDAGSAHRPSFEAPGRRSTVRIADIALFLRRYRRTLLITLAVFVALALAHILTATPEYTAAARLLVDTQRAQALQQDASARETTIDSPLIESQVESIRSDRVLSTVVEQHKLADDPEFVRKPDRPPAERAQIAEDKLGDHLAVRRVGQSRLIEVSVRSRDPEKAARLANAIAEGYMRQQLDAKSEAARRATQWLEERTAELRGQLNAATRAVEDFKAQNGIVEGGNRGLLNEQQLSDLNSQLVAANAQTAEARARLERIEAVLASGTPDAAVSEALRSEVITKLRQEYLEAATRETELSGRYGADHPAAVKLRDTMRDLGAAITNELRRIAEAYRSDYEIAKARQEATTTTLNRLVEKATQTRQAQARLQELESAAETYRLSFQSFLQKYAGAAQQQSFPIADAHIVAPATPPLNKSQPKPALALALAVVAGGVTGIGIATVRNHLDRTVRRPRDVRDALGLACLGVVPRLNAKRGQALHHAVLDAPFSRFADSLREVKTTLDVARSIGRLRTVGFVSARPGEGKSTLAANLAALYGQAGARALLIDADLRKAGLSRALAPSSNPGGGPGLAEVVAGRVRPDAAELLDERGGFRLLPAAADPPVAGSSDLLGSDAMRECLNELSQRHDIIILDLPPIRAVADARAVAPALDAVIVVAEHGGTPLDLLGDGVKALDDLQVQVMGVVLNKVNPHALRHDLAYAEEYR